MAYYGMKQAARIITEKIKKHNSFLRLRIENYKTYQRDLEESATIKLISDRQNCSELKEISSELTSLGVDNGIMDDKLREMRNNVLRIPWRDEQKEKIIELVNEINEEMSKP